MQRRVGQHHPEVGRARRHGRGDRSIGAPRREHDRPARRAQERARRVVELDERLGRVEVRRHHGERPLLAVLARAQRGDRVLVGGQAGQVIAADALDGDDRAAAQQRRRGGDRRRRHRRPRRRPAARAGPHAGQALGCAWKRRSDGSSYSAWQAGAHREARHRRVGPVVRDPAHDGEARPAVGAVDERVAVAAVGRVEQLGEARGAGRGVGRDHGGGLATGGAAEDREALVGTGLDRHVLGDHALDLGERRRLRGQPRDEGVHHRLGALDLDQHAVLVVEHVPAQAQLGREPVHVGPEAHALHRPLDPHAHAAQRHIRSAGHRARPARGARGRRSPAPPGCAGCAPSA